MRHLNKFICASIFFLIITSNLFSQTYWHEMEFSKLIELTLDEVKESEYVAVQSGSGYIYAIGDDVKRKHLIPNIYIEMQSYLEVTTCIKTDHFSTPLIIQ